jgi:hypothetical protein
LCRCCQRADCLVAPQKQQHHSIGVSNPESAKGKKALEIGWRRWWFELTLPAKIDQAEADWHAAQPAEPQPVITHEPVNDELQTGESRLLGGPMSIKSPWSN